jgi:hypothetical protein
MVNQISDEEICPEERSESKDLSSISTENVYSEGALVPLALSLPK